MDRGPGFLVRLKTNFKHIKGGKPGSRFLDCFHYKQELRRKYGPIYRRIDITLGAAVVFVGLVMVPMPGPGWIVVAAGLALIAGESENVARGMDAIERRLRLVVGKLKRGWKRSSIAMKSLAAICATAVASGLAYGAYLIWQVAFA